MAPPVRAPRTIDQLLREARARLRRLAPTRPPPPPARAASSSTSAPSGSGRTRGSSRAAHFVPRNVLEWRVDPTSGHRDPALARVRGPLILMCAQGYQSSLAAATLQELGVAQATDMIGGFEAWRDRGLPVLPATGSAG